jgi:predicted nucleic acid-binding protein
MTEMAEAGISGGAIFDALVAAAAREHGLVLATRDSRARSTYRALGVEVRFID